MSSKLIKPIYLVTDGSELRRLGKLVDAVEQALIGGEGEIYAVQLREQKGITAASDSEVAVLIEDLLPVCENHGAKLLINSRVDLARRYGAHGVHLNQSSPPVQEARMALGQSAVVGFSAHSKVECLALSSESVEYLLVAPVFKPISKPVLVDSIGVDALREITAEVSIPIFALGGVTAENAHLCRSAAASGIACLSSVLLDSNPRDAARNLVKAWRSNSGPTGATMG